MKKTLFLGFLLMVFGFAVNAQTTVPVTPAATETPAAPSNAKMVFTDGNSDTDLDYGTIEQNAEPLRIVKFTNTGTDPLIIKNARGSCGCTVPTWPKEPIMPGESSNIEIRYATNRLGKFNKTVTITTNEDKEHVIKVFGNVLDPKKDAEPVPTGEQNVIKGGGQ